MQNLEIVQLFVVYTKKECHLIPLKIVEIDGDPIMEHSAAKVLIYGHLVAHQF